jgi:hypothetical protein
MVHDHDGRAGPGQIFQLPCIQPAQDSEQAPEDYIDNGSIYSHVNMTPQDQNVQASGLPAVMILHSGHFAIPVPYLAVVVQADLNSSFIWIIFH